MSVELMSPAYGILEHLINTFEYRYYKDKRQDKEKTKAISASLIIITPTTNQV